MHGLLTGLLQVQASDMVEDSDSFFPCELFASSDEFAHHEFSGGAKSLLKVSEQERSQVLSGQSSKILDIVKKNVDVAPSAMLEFP